MNDKKCSAVIVAAGVGNRMQSDIPKQFMKLCGRPVLYYSVKAFDDTDFINEIVVVVSEAYLDYCRDEILSKYGFKHEIKITVGGDTRARSVYNGLKSCSSDTDYVFIHDAARPFVSEKILKDGLIEVMKHNAVIAALPSTDTIRIVDSVGNVTSTPDRRLVWRMQTPQIFNYEMLIGAYDNIVNDGFKGITDDGMVWEAAGNPPLHLYKGGEYNIKITTSEDMAMAFEMMTGGRIH